MISLNIEKTFGFISKEKVSAYEAEVKAAQEMLEKGTGEGNDFLGWLHLPSSISKEHLADLNATAKVLRDNCEVVIVAGIGGSYLGARAVIEALSNSFTWLQDKKTAPVMIYAGHNISEDYLYELTEYLKDKKFGVINISKSGTTTETALAFRLLKKQCEDQRGKETAKKVIVAVTDAKKGAARVTADKEGYKTFIIPDNVGGRFSVLTPVGLLPIAVAGFDIDKLVAGAADMEKACGSDVPFAENPAAIYAATRNELYRQGKKIEILVNFCPKLHYVSEWWKQLYGESEGKDNKGIFPASVDFSRRSELPCRQTGGRSEQNGRTGNSAGSRRRRCTQHAHRSSGTERIQHRRSAVLLRKSLRHQRLSVGRESFQPTGRGSIQEKYVCFAEQTGIRRRIKGYSG